MKDITKFLRAEKLDARLTELPDNFYPAMESEVNRLISEGAEIDEVLRLKATIQRTKAIRIKKIIRAALADAVLSEPKHTKEHFQPKERAFYEAIIRGAKEI